MFARTYMSLYRFIIIGHTTNLFLFLTFKLMLDTTLTRCALAGSISLVKLQTQCTEHDI